MARGRSARSGCRSFPRTNGWPQRAGKVVLQIGLTRARRYGDRRPAVEAQSSKRAPLGTEDYRPTLDAWQTGEQSAKRGFGERPLGIVSDALHHGNEAV